jgi:hypothetical protein
MDFIHGCAGEPGPARAEENVPQPDVSGNDKMNDEGACIQRMLGKCR